MKAMLDEAGVRVFLETVFQNVAMSGRRVLEISCASGRAGTNIQARVFMMPRAALIYAGRPDVKTLLGRSRNRFNSRRHRKPRGFLNALSLCYRIVKIGDPESPRREEIADGFSKSAFIYGLNVDELIVNTLDLVAGEAFVNQDYEAVLDLAGKRAAGHWAWLRTYPAFRDYSLKDVAPMLGIRESYRVVTDYILTEQDVRDGLAGQSHPDLVAVADHALDIHGGSQGAKELKGPYGIHTGA